MAEHEYGNTKNAGVIHNGSKQRFEININGQLSALEYTFNINPGSGTVSEAWKSALPDADPQITYRAVRLRSPRNSTTFVKPRTVGLLDSVQPFKFDH